MSIKFDGMIMEEIVYVNKVPYKYHTISAPLTDEKEIENDNKRENYYKQIFGLRGHGVSKQINEFADRAIYYVSVPKIFIKDKVDKFYQLYDVINIKDNIDKSRGKDLVLSLTYKSYNFKIFKDYNLDKLYVYVETEEGSEVPVNG